MTEIIRFPRSAMRRASTVGGTALAVKRTEPIHPELRAYAMTWLLRRREVLSRRLLISMPDRIRAKLEAEVAYIDTCIASVPAEDEAAVANAK
jgi:hypothetical protein